MVDDLNENNVYDCIVIGAGIAGLTAAYELHKAGLRVLILESKDYVGGRIQTISTDQKHVDTGAQFFSSEYHTILSLIKDLNLENSLGETSPKAASLKDRKLRILNKNNPLSLWLSGLFGFMDFMKLGLSIFKLQSKLKKIRLERISDWHEFDNEDAASWSLKNLNKNILDYLIEPFISGFTYTSPEKSSAMLAARTLGHLSANTDLLALENGLYMIIDALAKKLEIIKSCEVLEISEGKILTNKGEFHAGKIVCTTPSKIAKKLAYMPYQNLEIFDLNYSATMHLSYLIDKDLIPNKDGIYGMMISHLESSLINVVSIESFKHPGLVTDPSKELINIMLTNSGAMKLWDLSDDEIHDEIIRELKIVFKLPEIKVHAKTLVKWDKAIPLFHQGHVKAICKYRDELSADDTLFFAGDYLGTPCSEGAAESAKFIADVITSKRSS